MDSREADRWLRPLWTGNSPRRRLVCFPYAGGGATVFSRWATWLPDDTELRAVQLPGRQERLAEPGLTAVTDMRDRVLEALAVLPALPSAFYGHSLGGLLAFEVARALEARADPRQPTQGLILAACRPPLGDTPPTSAIRHLQTDNFVEALEQRYGGMDALRDPLMREIALPVLRADITAAETHSLDSDASVELDMTVLVGLEDRVVTPIAASRWRRLASGDFRVHQVDGGHLFVNTHQEWVRGQVMRHFQPT